MDFNLERSLAMDIFLVKGIRLVGESERASAPVFATEIIIGPFFIPMSNILDT